MDKEGFHLTKATIKGGSFIGRYMPNQDTWSSDLIPPEYIQLKKLHQFSNDRYIIVKLSDKQMILLDNLCLSTDELNSFDLVRIAEVNEHSFSLYQLKKNNIHFQFNSDDGIEIQWRAADKKLKIFAGYIVHPEVYYLRQKDGYIFSNRLDWLVNCYRNIISVDEKALIEKAFIKLILPPRTFFKEISRLIPNGYIEIDENNKRKFFSIQCGSFFHEELSSKYRVDFDLKIGDRLMSIMLNEKFNTVLCTSSAFNIGMIEGIQFPKNRFKFLAAECINTAISSKNQPDLELLQVYSSEIFNHLPIAASRILEPCCHFSEYTHSLLLERFLTEKTVFSDIGIYEYFKTLSGGIQNMKHDTHLVFNKKGHQSQSMKLFYRIKNKPAEYLENRWRETINSLRSYFPEFPDGNVNDHFLFELLVRLPEYSRKINTISKQLGIKVIAPFCSKEFLYSTILHSMKTSSEQVKVKESSNLVNLIKPLYQGSIADKSIVNLFDALFRAYYIEKGHFRHIFRFTRIGMRSRALNSSSDFQQDYTDFLITLLTGEYLSKVVIKS